MELKVISPTLFPPTADSEPELSLRAGRSAQIQELSHVLARGFGPGKTRPLWTLIVQGEAQGVVQVGTAMWEPLFKWDLDLLPP